MRVYRRVSIRYRLLVIRKSPTPARRPDQRLLRIAGRPSADARQYEPPRTPPLEYAHVVRACPVPALPCPTAYFG
jgi:hypothetical protein